MKKIMSIFVAGILALSLAACCAVDETLSTEPSEEVTEIVTEEIAVDENVIVDEGEDEGIVVTPDEEAKEDVNEEAKEDVNEEAKEESTEKTDEASLTLGNTLLKFFNEKAKEGKTINEIAEAITTHPSIVFNCMAAEMEKGYLPGFDEEITAFDKAVSFAPMIGSIPFVGYVFETEDADALIEILKKNANLRWNICVEAEEMVVGKNGNKVFFVMCPKEMSAE